MLAVPTPPELMALLAHSKREGGRHAGGLHLACIITPTALGALPPASRQVFADHWKEAARHVASVGVVIEGDGTMATVTRTFVRGLSVMLGSGWQHHPTARQAVLAAAAACSVEPPVALALLEDARTAG
jgi:hypothetical protein